MKKKNEKKKKKKKKHTKKKKKKKKEQDNAIYSNMEGTTESHTKCSKSERETDTISFISGI